MKTKTVYIVLGIAAVVGAAYYVRKKREEQAAAAIKATEPQPSNVIPKPASEATKIIKMPDSLLQNTSGNTGILPPVLTDPSKTTAVVPILKSVKKPINQQVNLQGYLMN